MVRTIRAIYEEGVFRPLDAFEGLPGRTTVRLVVETAAGDGTSLSNFAGIWSGQEADEVAAIIDAEFERVDLGEW